MKQILRYISVIVCCFCLFIGQFYLCVCAMDIILDTTPVSQSTMTSFLNIIDLEVLNEESDVYSISCFNVNSDGLIALGFENFEKKSIHLYSPEGSFLYGFQFSYDGSFGVFFEGDNVSIYFAKSGYVLTFSQSAICISMESVPLTRENNSQIRNLLYSPPIIVDGSTYHLEHKIGISARSYSKLVVTDEDGLETVLFDFSRSHDNISISSRDRANAIIRRL